MLASCPYNKKCLVESVDKLINNKINRVIAEIGISHNRFNKAKD